MLQIAGPTPYRAKVKLDSSFRWNDGSEGVTAWVPAFAGTTMGIT
ncbi:hypothetical protein [Lysobacter sp.]|nr:hypothetical protein [Lysobacter sp.]HZX78661.1 hypothetical protein [Lysobacter sp.]